MENHTSSTQNFERLTHSIEEEERELKRIGEKIRNKKHEYDHAKQVFDREAREMEELKKNEQELIQRRTKLVNESRTLQRQIQELNQKRGIKPELRL